jgi:hypothetical protein
MDNKVLSQRKSKRADLDQKKRGKVRLSPDELSEDEKNLRACDATEKLLKIGI